MKRCEKIVHRTFRITSRYRHQQIFPLGHFSKNHSRPSALVSTLLPSFGVRCRSDARPRGDGSGFGRRAVQLEGRRRFGQVFALDRHDGKRICLTGTRQEAEHVWSPLLSLPRDFSFHDTAPTPEHPHRTHSRKPPYTHWTLRPPRFASPKPRSWNVSCRCGEETPDAGTSSVAFCSASATTGPTS